MAQRILLLQPTDQVRLASARYAFYGSEDVAVFFGGAMQLG